MVKIDFGNVNKNAIEGEGKKGPMAYRTHGYQMRREESWQIVTLMFGKSSTDEQSKCS